MKKFHFLPLFLLVFCTLSRAQVPAGLQAILDHTLDSMRIKLGGKGLGAAVQLSSGASWAGASGISANKPAANVTTNDAFLIGSVTKTITSACILQLTDEGTLSLEDSLGKWLTDLSLIDPKGYINRKITIRQLLRHQSGIYDVLSHPDNQFELLSDISKIWTPEALIERFIKAPIFAPGATWSYSNTNYFLLGMIIQKATGKPFYQELRKRFFAPLALNSIAIPAFEPLSVPVAHVWLDTTGDNITEDVHNFYMSYRSLNSTAGAAGGYFSTPTDLATWIRTYMRGDLVSPARMAEAKATIVAPGQPITYGLGLMKKTFLTLEAFGHGGDLAYAASAWYFPSKDISIVVMTNDSKKNSWTLIPTVTALLKSYLNWSLSSSAEEPNIADNWALKAYPNPMNDALTVSLDLPYAAQEVQIALTDPLGRTVASLRRNDLPTGPATVEFDNLNGLPAGIYFVAAQVDGRLVQTTKLVKQ